jgi:hypothetical protein
MGRLQRSQESPAGLRSGLCRELGMWWPALWTFARAEGVELTNNVAGRALRPAVLWSALPTRSPGGELNTYLSA